ncbi:MAG: CDP-alcohol phosphatidyltransferase family protein [Candidatus Bathyarchaeota archaeon]|nr:CDP-alcohol phosphatidyltransferase family protein [Candidatus Bathyarchaeota archaeon]
MANTNETRKAVLTKLKKQIQQLLTGQAEIAHKMGLTPNHISVIGFILAFASAISYALFTPQTSWLLLLATFFLLASGYCDTMDGIVARTFKQSSSFGGFFDSVLDRFADGTSYAGIIVAGLCSAAFGWYWGTIVALSALVASMLVSYTRARAEIIGVKMESVGIAERAERMLILAAVSIIGFFKLEILGYGVALIAVLSAITVLQRVLHVHRELKKKAAE